MKCKDPLHSVQVCWHANMDIKNICNLGPIKPPKGPKWRRTNPNITLSKASLSLWMQKSAQSDNINAMQSHTSWCNKKYFCCNITGFPPCNYVLMTAEQLWDNRLLLKQIKFWSSPDDGNADGTNSNVVPIGWNGNPRLGKILVVFVWIGIRILQCAVQHWGGRWM